MLVIYDEDTGVYTIKHGLIGWLDIHLNEKDICLTKINELREIADITTLTKYDIDLLFNFAQSAFQFKDNKNNFMMYPLKDIFPNDGLLTIGQLMILISKK